MSEPVEIPIDLPLTVELETDIDFGAETTDEALSGFAARINDQPIALRLRELQAQADIPDDSAISLLYESYELWLVPHRVSIIRRRGLAEPTSVGIEVEYLTDGRTCCIVSLIPSFEYVVHGSASVGGEFSGQFTANGVANPGALAFRENLPQVGQMKLGVTTDMQLGFKFQMTIATPKIAAVGVGSSRCEWRLDRDVEPLFGRDIETWAVVALSSDEELRYRMRFYYNARTLFFNTRRESPWHEIKCLLMSRARQAT